MRRARQPRRGVVVGGGAAGVAAARRLAASGVHVTLLEAGPRLGGCVRTVDFAGSRIDVGAEALHTAAPGPRKLVADLGLEEDLVAAGTGPTWIAAGDRLRPLPAGVGPAGPTRLRPLLQAGLLSPAGILRAALEPLVARSSLVDDPAVGDVLARRFGHEVVDRIVDPLLGGLHAGDVRRLSLSAATPRLAGLLGRHRSVLLATRGRAAADHGFVTLRGGMEGLFAAAVDDVAGDLRLEAPARALVVDHGAEGRYRVVTDTGDVHGDVVVLAVPPPAAARCLATIAPDAPGILDGFRAASVSVALLAYPAEAAELPALAGTGILVPSSSPRLLKAATFLTTKWPHLSSPYVLVRASSGRVDDRRAEDLDDATLTARLADDLHALAGLPPAPVHQRVVRWRDAMPQLEVGHGARTAALRAALTPCPGVAVAGAAYDGVGLAAAIQSGEDAADEAISHLSRSTR